MKTILERFEDKYIPEPNSGCWLWDGATNLDGYGVMRTKGVEHRAHRISHRLFKGEIPSGLEVDHLCNVRCCVNPDHLKAVTHAENCARHRRSLPQTLVTHCPKGHPYDTPNTYISPSGSRHCRTCQRLRLRDNRGYTKIGSDWRKRETHCKRGHLLGGKNLRVDPKTQKRVCRECRRLLAAIRRKKLRSQESTRRAEMTMR